MITRIVKDLEFDCAVATVIYGYEIVIGRDGYKYQQNYKGYISEDKLPHFEVRDTDFLLRNTNLNATFSFTAVPDNGLHIKVINNENMQAASLVIKMDGGIEVAGGMYLGLLATKGVDVNPMVEVDEPGGTGVTIL